MTKKEELKMLFDFLIEMLKEDNTKTELLTEESKPSLESKPSNKKETFDFDHVLNLMKKVDSIQDEKAKINTIVSQNKKMLETELKRVKDTYEKSLNIEKTIEDTPEIKDPIVTFDEKDGTISIIDGELKK